MFSSYYFLVKPTITNDEKALENYIANQEKAFNKLIQDTVLMRKLVQKKESLEDFERVADEQYSFFLYAETLFGKNELIVWNNQKVIPPPSVNDLPEGEYFETYNKVSYVIVKKYLNLSGISDRIIAYALIPVLYKYELETDILINYFVHSKSAIKKIYISKERTPYAIQSLNEKPLFYIGRIAHASTPTSDTFTLVLRFAASLIFLLYIHLIAESVVRKKGIIKGVVFLNSIFILLRIIMLLFPDVFYLNQFELFHPIIYSANKVNPSLGDLLLNCIFFCWMVIFTWYNLGPKKRLPTFLKGKGILAAGIVALLLFVVSTFGLAGIVRSLVANSTISFDVTNFFSLSFYTVIGFVVLALLLLSYYYFTRLLFRFIFPAFKKLPNLIYFIIALSGLIFISFLSSHALVLFYIPVLGWLIIYTLLFSQEQFIINRFKITIAGVLFWIFIFSVSLSAIILKENQKKEIENRKTIAETQHEKTEPSQEKTLSIALAYLDQDFLSNNYKRFLNLASNRFLRDSIINENSFRGYTSAYTTQIYVYDSLNRGLFNFEDPRSFAELNTIFTVRSKPTGIPDLYYHETSFDNLLYITKRRVYIDNRFLGTMFIISTPRKYTAETLYPEIFRQYKRRDIESSNQYYYAIYKKGILTEASTKYPFKTYLTLSELPASEFERIFKKGYDELWYKPNNNKLVIVVKKQDSFFESITLFSYLFCAFLFMVAFLQLFALILRSAYGWKLINIFSGLSIRTQLHGTFIFISVFLFVIIGAATISFFISRYNINNEEKLSRTSGIMVREMQKRLTGNGNSDSLINLMDSGSNYNFQKLVNEVADIHNVDVNVYDLKGNLQVTSQSEVYKTGIVSTKINPVAYYNLSRLRKVQFVQIETLNMLKYLSIYAPVRNNKGTVYAYLNIPYFSSEADLEQEISNFLVTIINLNAFIFLIAGIIALFITNQITRSFLVISDKMKEITLGKTNEEIVWTRRDEIGELIMQYNSMVKQLEQSASALAKSEREGAWREMARQVAHEIKNPLTPMKLSIQYLQKAISSNQDNVKELTSRVANTLIEQIDHLSKIAADFSQFAHIGNLYVESFDMHAVLQSLIDLYKSNPNIVLSWQKVEGEVLLHYDRTQINRLFTNLLTNSVEACTTKRVCTIEITEELVNPHHVLIMVKDNGEGIPEEMHSKMFTPNFTTKSHPVQV